MTFTQFLQVLAFNLLSNTIPLCLLLYVTAYFIAKMYEKRFSNNSKSTVGVTRKRINPNTNVVEEYTIEK